MQKARKRELSQDSQHLNRRMRGLDQYETMARSSAISSYGCTCMADEVCPHRFSSEQWSKLFDHRVMERTMRDASSAEQELCGLAQAAQQALRVLLRLH
eukprot:4052520-Amphidinium_carterae.1